MACHFPRVEVFAVPVAEAEVAGFEVFDKVDRFRIVMRIGSGPALFQVADAVSVRILFFIGCKRVQGVLHFPAVVHAVSVCII